ncbi:signal transduction histidine kinase [Paenibacillus sp. DS2015]|uniref:ATP-binding protein n=1 Tax=Paenibacillus sp. DS2015 TaxID=3373917 RepID=UPI003D1F2EBA
MKFGLKWFVYIIVVLMIVLFVDTSKEHSKLEESSSNVTQWQFMWEHTSKPRSEVSDIPSSGKWTWLKANQALPADRSKSDAAWIKLQLPPLELPYPALLINPIYAQKVSVYINTTLIYEVNRDYGYDLNKILLPLHQKDGGKDIYIHVQTNIKSSEIGLLEELRIGDYSTMINVFVRENLIDVILGSSVIFIALIMLICTLFLKKVQMPNWLSLSIVLISIGTLILTYSPFLYTYYGEYGKVFVSLFDISLYVCFPGLTYIFETMIGKGYRSIIRKYRKFQVAYSLFGLAFMFVNLLAHNALFDLYYVFSVTILGILIIIQGILLVTSAGYYASKRNKDAIIISAGFAVFSLCGISEMIWFYIKDGDYNLFMWKWGVMGFVMSLIVLLGRKFALNHQRVVEYSKELALFNNELQRSEKMDIISELAASVAHEVRNPLQVTRGFLQLLEEKSNGKEKGYLKLALEELERASNIITDFLTFAKPEIEQVATLDISGEFKHIEGILIPLANLQGGSLHTSIPPGLTIEGNSSKFKQAFINMIKNSIEALEDHGFIHIWAYQEKDQIIIHIQDNGEGMGEAEIMRLGEPYYSNKTKGTGLGLMVTYRIIEAMKGNIKFKSEKGIGTEAIITFPATAAEGRGIDRL